MQYCKSIIRPCNSVLLVVIANNYLLNTKNLNESCSIIVLINTLELSHNIDQFNKYLLRFYNPTPLHNSMIKSYL